MNDKVIQSQEVLGVKEALKEQGLALINVDINGSDFKRSLSYKDLGLDKDVERDLATLGRKSVLGKKYPLELRKNKESVYNYMDKMGIRFGGFGTWAVPTTIYEEVHQQLRDKQSERDAIKEMLVSHYDELVVEFANEAEELRPGFGAIVKANAFDVAHVIEQISMNVSPQEDIMSGVGQGAVDGLGRIAYEYEQAILTAAKKGNTRPVITRFTRNKLQEMKDYCDRFMFLTTVLNNAGQLIQETLAILPATVIKTNAYLNETSKVMTTLKLLQKADELDGVVTPQAQPEVAFDDIDDEEDESNEDPALESESNSDVEESISLATIETERLSVNDDAMEDVVTEMPKNSSILDVLGINGNDDDDEDEDDMYYY
jgi:hypothetical protein